MAKKAGDQIVCVKCAGKGYVLSWARDVPIECSGCQGTGVQKIRPSVWGR